MIKTPISPGTLAGLQERANTFEHVVLVLNVPNKNGRTYPTDVVYAALSSVVFPIFGCFMSDLHGGTIPLERVTHIVNSMRIEDDKVIASLRILDQLPQGAVLRALTDRLGEHDYRTSGLCTVDPNNVVSKFDFLTIGALAPGQGA